MNIASGVFTLVLAKRPPKWSTWTRTFLLCGVVRLGRFAKNSLPGILKLASLCRFQYTFLLMALISETTVRVRYAETDQMGVAYYGNYFTWFEIGRVEFLRDLGLDYATLEKEHGCFIMVADAHCRYKAPARYDDLLRIRTKLESLRGPLIKFGYEVLRDADSALLAEGDTTHLVADTSMKPRALPERYLRVMEEAMAGRQLQA